MDLHAFFRNEVKPALGCTEPGAVALACARAARELSGPPRHLHLRLSANIYKNGMTVGIPGPEGANLRGNLLAAALGVLAGDPDKGLLALESITAADVAAAESFLDAGRVTQEVARDVPDVFVEAELLRQGESASAIVAQAHDLVAEVRRNGKVVHAATGAGGNPTGQPQYVKELPRLPFAKLWELARSIDDGLESFLLDGAAMNMAIAADGLDHPWGLGAGHTYARVGNMGDLLWRVRATSAAAADVRMAGGGKPVMSSAGSGNHGLTAVIPLAVLAKDAALPPRALAESLALSHLVTGAVKAKTGRLTPVCGCSVAAGAGAAAGLVRLLGGAAAQAEQAVALLLAAVLGMVCDGAKASCALKVACAASEAYMAAQLALNGPADLTREGVVGRDFGRNTAAVGELSQVGLAAVDAVVLRLMEKAQEEGPDAPAHICR